MEYQSKRQCSICKKEILVRDVRKKNFFCSQCKAGAPAFNRYGNFQNNSISDATREKLMKDKTLRVGQFSYGKKK